MPRVITVAFIGTDGVMYGVELGDAEFEQREGGDGYTVISSTQNVRYMRSHDGGDTWEEILDEELYPDRTPEERALDDAVSRRVEEAFINGTG